MTYDPPVATGYLHVPPLWVRDDFAPDDFERRIVTQHVDVSTAGDLISAETLSEDISVWFCRDGFA